MTDNEHKLIHASDTEYWVASDLLNDLIGRFLEPRMLSYNELTNMAACAAL